MEISEKTNSEIIETLTDIGIIKNYSHNIYLLNLAWEGYCRINKFDNYEIAPFNKEDRDFAQYWWDKLINGEKFESMEVDRVIQPTTKFRPQRNNL